MKPGSSPHQTRIRVRYAETDQMGIVHHANYYVWMEVARVELCRQSGLRYRDLEAEGVLMAVVETSCRYASAARFDDEVLIETRTASASSRVVRFLYELSVDGRPVASGETKHVFLSRQLKPIRLPAQYNSLFGLPERIPPTS